MPAARLDFRNRRLASLALAALFVGATTLSSRAALDRFDEMLHGDQYVSEGFRLDTQTFRVRHNAPMVIRPAGEVVLLETIKNVSQLLCICGFNKFLERIWPVQ